MGTSLVIVDGFYSDVDNVRRFALASDFSIRGNYPGRRTPPLLHADIRNAIESAVHRPIGFWPEDTYNGAFQITTRHDRTWVHADYTTNWAGVLFLVPNAPPAAGTAFFRHRSTGLDVYPEDPKVRSVVDADGQFVDRWEVIDRVANVYNRLVLFRSDRFHASEAYFGESLADGRLFQTFFFSTC